MRELPLEVAEKIARLEYWEAPAFNRVAELSPAIAYELFEQNFNLRYRFAGEALQRLLNALNRDRTHPDLKIDGRIGPQTMASLKRFLEHRRNRGEAVLLELLNGLQAAEYVRIVEQSENQRAFLYGWAKRTRL